LADWLPQRFQIRNAEMPAQDITICEADEGLGGGLFLTGNVQSGYKLPGSAFEIASTRDPDGFQVRNARRIAVAQERAFDRAMGAKAEGLIVACNG